MDKAKFWTNAKGDKFKKIFKSVKWATQISIVIHVLIQQNTPQKVSINGYLVE